MTSMQTNPDMAGQGQLPGNLTRERVGQIYQVCLF